MKKFLPGYKKRDENAFDPGSNPHFATIPVEAEQPSTTEQVSHAAWEIFKTVSVILVAALIIRTFLVQPFFVDGNSMQPTFQPSDYLLVNQLSYHFSKPRHGDIVVFKAPPEPTENYIKRIVGVPGDTVELKNGGVMIKNSKHPQGVMISEPYVRQNTRTQPETEQTSWKLSGNDYFVAGDNREPGMSSDSRAWGPVPRENIIGKVALRVYPIASLGTIKQHEFPEFSRLEEALASLN